MAARNSDLYWAHFLRDEVLYLHGLWRQGSHPSSTVNLNNNINRKLRPRHSAKLKKSGKNHLRGKKAVFSEKEWPLDPAPDPNEAVACWPEPLPKPPPRPLSGEDLAAGLAARAQNNGVEECKRFFSKDIDGDSEESDLEEEEDEEEEVEERGFKFFMEIFTKDDGLRRYYEANCEKGEFLCLVCEGSGAKKGRTYGDCVGLVQHCINVVKIGRRGSHRGLARALCRVVGWNFGRLPLVVLDLEETLGQKLARDDASLQQEKSEEADHIHNEAVE